MSEMSPTNVITATANIKKSTFAIAACANNDITLSFKQHPTSQKIVDRALPFILQGFLKKILYFFQQNHPTLSLLLSSTIDNSVVTRLLILLAIDRILPIILPSFIERIDQNYLSKFMTILFSKFIIKSSRIIPKHRWLCTKNGILKTNSNQVSTLSVRFNDNPPKLYLFNKSLQEQVPVLQVAGPSKGKYSRAELEEHREFMLTKIRIAVKKKKWRSVKRLIGVAFKTFTNY
nr:8143_t:CDS:2 [Entrophospora candida]CAG8662499.1 8430_t:CDS:2 [Entrophospora candida]